MMLPDMFLQLVLQMGASMTTPTLNSLATVVKGWLFAGRHTLTGVLVAIGGSGPKHHSAYYRLFAACMPTRTFTRTTGRVWSGCAATGHAVRWRWSVCHERRMAASPTA